MGQPDARIGASPSPIGARLGTNPKQRDDVYCAPQGPKCLVPGNGLVDTSPPTCPFWEESQDPSKQVRDCIGFIGWHSKFMDVYGVLWMFMDVYGVLWCFMDVYGVLQIEREVQSY